jgi:hypothetical protein
MNRLVQNTADFLIQNRVISPSLGGGLARPPLLLRLLAGLPLFRRLPARLLGLGVRPEHVHSPAIA